MTLTLVPVAGARPGAHFVYRGPNAPGNPVGNTGEECEGCPVQRICFSLENGRRYRVEAVRDVVHPCGLHEEGKVRVVQVAEAPFPTSLERKHLRGTAAPWSAVPCGMPECPNYALCHPVGPTAGARHQVVTTDGALACPAGYDLERVHLQRMPPDAVTGL